MTLPEHEYFTEGQVFHGYIPLVMGTRLEVLLCGASTDVCEGIWDEMCTMAMSWEAVMNRFDPESEVSRINAGNESVLSAEMSHIISLCEHYRKSTGGLFDIGRGTVEWKQAFRSNSAIINLHGGNLDFGGFGKGFLLKEFKKMLLDAGITTAYLDFGGSSILALGHHPHGHCWKVGVTDPFSGTVIKEVELTDMAMSTSGNQPGYDAHITDPRNGTAITGKKLVTILSEDPVTAETASTAAMIANPDELDYIMENNDIASVFGLPTSVYGK